MFLLLLAEELISLNKKKVFLNIGLIFFIGQHDHEIFNKVNNWSVGLSRLSKTHETETRNMCFWN